MDRRTRIFLAAGLLVALVVAAGVSQFSSNDPDGLEFVAEQEGFADTADDPALGDSLLADYGENLTGNRLLDRAIAGVAGVAITLVIGLGVFWLVRRSRHRREPTAPA